jgi:hypothetical protein
MLMKGYKISINEAKQLNGDWAPGAHNCNPPYLRSSDQGNSVQDSWAKISGDTIYANSCHLASVSAWEMSMTGARGQ